MKWPAIEDAPNGAMAFSTAKRIPFSHSLSPAPPRVYLEIVFNIRKKKYTKEINTQFSKEDRSVTRQQLATTSSLGLRPVQ